MLPKANGRLELRKIGVPESEPSLMAGSPNQYLSYLELPAGPYRLAIYKQGDHKNPLGAADINLRVDAYATVLVSPQAGRIGVEVLDDTNDPKAVSGTLTVRNYYNGLTVDVASQTQKLTDGVAYGQSRTISGLPLRRIPLVLHFHLPNQQSAESGAEADLQSAKRATLLIIPDYKGRFCPRLTVDGKNL